MSLTTIEGVLIALVFVLPSALGLHLRSYLWSSRNGSSTEALIAAVAFSVSALLFLEFLTAFLGATMELDATLGDFPLA